MTEEKAQKMLADLAKHYGQPVRPVGEYCEALRDWVRVCAEHDKEVDGGIRTSGGRGNNYSPLHGVDVFAVELGIMKSNYLSRRIYDGEKTRTIKCPIHEGSWSGCHWGDGMCPEGCMSGANVTGWLPKQHEFVEPPPLKPHQADPHISRRWCYQCGGTPEAEIHSVSGDE